MMIHAALLAAYLPAHLVARHGHPSVAGAAVTGIVLGAVLALVGGIMRKRRLPVGLLALAGGAALGVIPWAFGRLASFMWRQGFGGLPVDLSAVALSVFAGTFVVGLFFMALTVLGVAADEGFGPLAHPGYKHFVRLRIKHDGSVVDGFAIGKVDPLAPGSKPVLVDRFRWENPRNNKVT